MTESPKDSIGHVLRRVFATFRWKCDSRQSDNMSRERERRSEFSETSAFHAQSFLVGRETLWLARREGALGEAGVASGEGENAEGVVMLEGEHQAAGLSGV